jgi:hypothetical protein
MFTNLHSCPVTGTAMWELHHISDNHLQVQFLITVLSLCIQQEKPSFTISWKLLLKTQNS